MIDFKSITLYMPFRHPPLCLTILCVFDLYLVETLACGMRHMETDMVYCLSYTYIHDLRDDDSDTHHVYVAFGYFLYINNEKSG